MGGKSGSQTIGYKYFMSLLMGISRGSLSEIVQINAGEKMAWRGPLCMVDDTTFMIRAKDLFGGDQKEGGIEGPCKVLWGKPDQTLPGPVGTLVGTLPGVKETISPGAPMPALRGVTCLWYDGEICSINPYPKEWKMRVRRHIHGWYADAAWYPSKAIIYLQGPTNDGSSGLIKAMNGAHIIYECVTNPEWGRGITADLLDENSFIYAANQLCEEAFGLCFFWTRQEDVDVFIQTVLDHIGGELYTDRSSGLLTLRLIRDDYDIADLPTFEPGKGLLEILADDSGSQDIAYNEVVIKYHDPNSDTDGEQRAHNVGARIAQGSTNSLTKEMPGLPTAGLASRVALRELIVQSAGLKKYKVRLDRSGWRIAPGMPFAIKCPERGIDFIVLRAGEITDSSAQQGGDIQISALEDVFSMPATGMTVPETPTWTPPNPTPLVPNDSLAFELTYYDMVKHLDQLSIPNVNPEDAYMAFVSSQPSPTQLLYDLKLKVGTDWGQSVGTFSFTANGQLVNAVSATGNSLMVESRENWPDDIIGDSLIIGEERMRVDSYNPETGEIIVARGTVDTRPMSHPAGATIWFPDDDLASDRVSYVPGEVVTAAAATRTNSAVLEDELLDPRSVTILGRQGAPYPPADIKVNGNSIYGLSGEFEEPVITWATRNRVMQEDELIGWFEGSVPPEAGTTWEVIIKALDGTEISTYNVPEGTTEFTYDAAAQAADGSPVAVLVDVKAVRDGIRSILQYDVPVVITGGWDYSWGFNWS